MRFSTTLTVAASLLCVDAAVCGHRPSRPVPNRVSTLSSVSQVPTTLSTPTSVVVTTTASAKSSVVSIEATATSTTATAATTSVASSAGLTSDQQKALDAHNSARSEVGTAALVWDAGLAAEAQAYAEKLASTNTFQHSGVSGEGENLYMGYGSTPNLDATNAWVSEKSSYNGEKITSTNYMNFGHYTQVVWKSTTKVGLGAAKSSSGATYVVGRYAAPGNFIGQTAY